MVTQNHSTDFIGESDDHISHTVIQTINSLPNDKILAFSKSKTFADDKLNLTRMMIPVSDWVENIVGKEENAGKQHFLHFKQCFQKAYFSGSLKIRIVW